MSRHRSAGAYDFAIEKLGGSDYRLWWTVDRYYAGQRGRFPRRGHRDTDEAGAIRFAKRHRPHRMPDEIRAKLPSLFPLAK